MVSREFFSARVSDICKMGEMSQAHQFLRELYNPLLYFCRIIYYISQIVAPFNEVLEPKSIQPSSTHDVRVMRAIR